MSAASSARQILTRLHEVMAGRTHAQHKLDRVVEIIAESLTSEVCSIYLLREGALELYATQGLNPEAVHVTRLAIGEGLAGTIAQNIETLNLAEAKAHPDFAYRPETGEEKFHSFAGVPIVYRERAVGVLCVQHVEPRRYEDVEIEALQTTAMVLSELIAHKELVDEEGQIDLEIAHIENDVLQGLTLVKGLAAGRAVFHQPRIEIDQVVAEDIEAERQRYQEACDELKRKLASKQSKETKLRLAAERGQTLAEREVDQLGRRCGQAVRNALFSDL